MTTRNQANQELDFEEGFDGNPASVVGWTDLRFPATSTKKLSGKEPNEVIYQQGMVYEFEGNQAQAVVFNAQMDHGYKNGTDLDFHVHVILPVGGSGAGVENISFEFTYSWAEIGADFPTFTRISNPIDIQNLGPNTHLLWDIGTIPNADKASVTGDGVSSMLICSLARDITVADNSSKSVYLVEADFHYQVDQPRGSRKEYEK